MLIADQVYLSMLNAQKAREISLEENVVLHGKMTAVNTVLCLYISKYL